jgi:hypothetical protein
MASAPATLRVPVIGALPGTTIEPEPGKRFVALPHGDVIPPVAMAQLIPEGGGSYRLVAQITPRWFAVTEENFKKLGIGISRKSMVKLIRAGFVDGTQTLPQVHQFDYFSWLAHLEATRTPGFWEKEEMRGEPPIRLSNREWLYRATLERY